MRNLIQPLFTFNRQFTIDIKFMNCTFQQLMTMPGYIVSSSSMNTNINFYCLFVSYTTRRIFALIRIKQEKEDVIWLVVSSNINARTVLIETIFMFWWPFLQLAQLDQRTIPGSNNRIMINWIYTFQHSHTPNRIIYSYVPICEYWVSVSKKKIFFNLKVFILEWNDIKILRRS